MSVSATGAARACPYVLCSVSLFGRELTLRVVSLCLGKYFFAMIVVFRTRNHAVRGMVHIGSLLSTYVPCYTTFSLSMYMVLQVSTPFPWKSTI